MRFDKIFFSKRLRQTNFQNHLVVKNSFLSLVPTTYFLTSLIKSGKVSKTDDLCQCLLPKTLLKSFDENSAEKNRISKVQANTNIFPCQIRLSWTKLGRYLFFHIRLITTPCAVTRQQRTHKVFEVHSHCFLCIGPVKMTLLI